MLSKEGSSWFHAMSGSICQRRAKIFVRVKICRNNFCRHKPILILAAYNFASSRTPHGPWDCGWQKVRNFGWKWRTSGGLLQGRHHAQIRMEMTCFGPAEGPSSDTLSATGRRKCYRATRSAHRRSISVCSTEACDEENKRSWHKA